MSLKNYYIVIRSAYLNSPCRHCNKPLSKRCCMAISQDSVHGYMIVRGHVGCIRKALRKALSHVHT